MSCWNMCHKCNKDIQDCTCYASRAKKKVYITMEGGLIQCISATKDLKDVEFTVIDFDDPLYVGEEDLSVCNDIPAFIYRRRADELVKLGQFKIRKPKKAELREWFDD